MLIRAKDYHIVIGSGEIRTGTAFSDWKAVEIDLLTGERKDRPKPGVVGMLDWFEEAGRVVKLNPGNVSTEAKKYRRLRILGHQYEDQDNDEEQGIEEQGTEEQGTDNNKKDTKQVIIPLALLYTAKANKYSATGVG